MSVASPRLYSRSGGEVRSRYSHIHGAVQFKVGMRSNSPFIAAQNKKKGEGSQEETKARSKTVDRAGARSNIERPVRTVSEWERTVFPVSGIRSNIIKYNMQYYNDCKMFIPTKDEVTGRAISNLFANTRAKAFLNDKGCAWLRTPLIFLSKYNQ